ncbi:MAG: hypothetical protein M1282_11540 [Chloroflexi bacterium]|nr:hypothetical protein [Chloroflexota bacterium]
MIGSLLTTIVIEGLVVTVYAFWKRKPVGRILLASILANVLTQSALWIVLNLSFARYLIALFVSEIFIWLIESLFLRFFPGSQLGWKESVLLSLVMNISSFGVGWFLPV